MKKAILAALAAMTMIVGAQAKEIGAFGYKISEQIDASLITNSNPNKARYEADIIEKNRLPFFDKYWTTLTPKTHTVIKIAATGDYRGKRKECLQDMDILKDAIQKKYDWASFRKLEFNGYYITRALSLRYGKSNRNTKRHGPVVYEAKVYDHSIALMCAEGKFTIEYSGGTELEKLLVTEKATIVQELSDSRVSAMTKLVDLSKL